MAQNAIRWPSGDHFAIQSSKRGVFVIRRGFFPSARIIQRSCWLSARLLEKRIERPSGDQLGNPSSGLISPGVSVKVSRVTLDPSGRILKISGLPSLSRLLANAIQRPSGDQEGELSATHFAPGVSRVEHRVV